MTKPSLTRRRHRRYDREPVNRVVIRGLVVSALLGTFTWFALTVYSGVPGKSYEYVTASVPRAGNLLVHDPVRIAGRRVGQVDEIKAASNGRTSIRLQLESGTSLPRDSKIVLRANGLLGARYVELKPGRSPARLNGAVIRGGETSVTYGVTDVLDVFDKETRGGLGRTIGELGKGTLGQGRPLNDTIFDASRAIVPEQRLMQQLAAPSTDLPGLLPSIDAGMAPLDANRATLGRLIAATPAALQPIVDRGGRVRESLVAAPDALTAADTGLTRGRSLLTSVRSVAREARVTLEPAPPGLRTVAALLDEAPKPLERTRTLLGSVGRSVDPVLGLVERVDPLLVPLRELAGDLIPIATTVGRHKCDFGNFGAVFRSVTGFGGNGEGPNGPAMAFRLTSAPPLPGEAIGVEDGTGLSQRESYTPACKFLSKPYPIVSQPSPPSAGSKR